MSLIIRQKKGALQLSINAIVVLILAITMLGLGLGFMRNMFENTTGQFEDISSSMKDEVKQKIENSNDKVTLNVFDIDLKKSDTKEIYYGVKNVEPDTATPPVGLQFETVISCDSSMADGTAGANQIGFEYFTGPRPALQEGDVDILKMKITPKSSVKLTTYDCSIEVSYASGANSGDVYDTKKFYITIR